jgi:hypothetical protein
MLLLYMIFCIGFVGRALPTAKRNFILKKVGDAHPTLLG